MQFDPVETGFDRQRGGFCVFANCIGDFLRRHGVRRAVGLHALGIRPHFPGQGGGARANNLRAGRQVGDVRDTTGVHELHDDLPALVMHGLRDQAPSLDVRFVEKPGDPRVAQPVGRWGNPLRDEQAGGRALRVVLSHQRIGGVVLDGATARHRRHHDAVAQGKASCGIGIEQHVVALKRVT